MALAKAGPKRAEVGIQTRVLFAFFVFFVAMISGAQGTLKAFLS
jgi:hypothetical protein